MNKTEILVVGTARETVEKTVAIVNDNEEWSGMPAFSDEEAIAKFQQLPIEIVLLTKDISDVQQRKLSKLFTFQNPGVTMAGLEGDDATALRATINTILETKKNAKEFSFVVIDDALKNAGLNIQIQ